LVVLADGPVYRRGIHPPSARRAPRRDVGDRYCVDGGIAGSDADTGPGQAPARRSTGLGGHRGRRHPELPVRCAGRSGPGRAGRCRVVAELLVVRPGDRSGRASSRGAARTAAAEPRGGRHSSSVRSGESLPHVLGIIGMRGELPKLSSASVASPVAAPALTLVAVPENPSGPAPCVEGYTVGSSSRSMYSWPRPRRSAVERRRLLPGVFFGAAATVGVSVPS